jgi:hypothetical protein
MEHDIEKDGRFAYSKQGLEEDEVTGTTDGQKFGQSLNDTEKNSLCNIDFILLENVKSPPDLPLLKGGEGGLLIDFELWHSLEFIYKLQFS